MQALTGPCRQKTWCVLKGLTFGNLLKRRFCHERRFLNTQKRNAEKLSNFALRLGNVDRRDAMWASIKNVVFSVSTARTIKPRNYIEAPLQSPGHGSWRLLGSAAASRTIARFCDVIEKRRESGWAGQSPLLRLLSLIPGFFVRSCAKIGIVVIEVNVFLTNRAFFFFFPFVVTPIPAVLNPLYGGRLVGFRADT